MKPVWPAVLLLVAPAACDDANRFTAEDKAHLIARQQADMDQLNAADATVAALNDPRSRQGRRVRREAAERRKRSQGMLDTIQNLQVRE